MFSPEQIETDTILRYFASDHLLPCRRGVSEKFALMAHFVIEYTPRCAERTVALRKLLEAKDAAVRAAL